MNRIFVYGTLKSGMPNHSLITDDKKSKLVFDNAIIRGRMFSLGQYPAICPDHWGYSNGEVWEVSDETLAILDQLEGHPNFYTRHEVTLVDSEKWKVWAYLMSKAQLPKYAVPMPVGNWPNIGTRIVENGC